MSELFDKIRKRIPLRTRLKVLNEMMIQSFLIDNGYIPDGYWDDEKEEKYGKEFRELASKMADAEIETFNEWEKHGRPVDNTEDLEVKPYEFKPEECEFFDEAQGRHFCGNRQLETKRCVGTKCGKFESK